MKTLTAFITLLLFAGVLSVQALHKDKHKPKRVLVFSKTTGFRHDCIPVAKTTIMQLGKDNGFEVDTTEDAAAFTSRNLKKYAAVIFSCTTGDVLDSVQQIAFQQYIHNGGAWMGIHAATDTEYDWPWYNKLAGAYFLSHPRQQQAKLLVVDHNHPAAKELPDEWVRKDEWYNFKDISPDIHVLIKIDEKSYEGGKNGDNHPMCWYHEFEGGRAFYTELGHTKESYSDPLYLKHLLGGIQYAIGTKHP
ncbi:MAG TPA: ThuA domain-containing protein [Chitinophaga sp.]|uniref:ThuA domain-containing protein n=1 Tax=Chitinophaga sp. TaxID=1869181 RepID=UPI002BB36A9E|nr:ThuA domain-containing protein [Chitinophaga sp.]HVI48716.1 ThuA domain-containing protein [Chitinophaga sp.]